MCQFYWPTICLLSSVRISIYSGLFLARSRLAILAASESSFENCVPCSFLKWCETWIVWCNWRRVLEITNLHSFLLKPGILRNAMYVKRILRAHITRKCGLRWSNSLNTSADLLNNVYPYWSKLFAIDILNMNSFHSKSLMNFNIPLEMMIEIAPNSHTKCFNKIHRHILVPMANNNHKSLNRCLIQWRQRSKASIFIKIKISIQENKNQHDESRSHLTLAASPDHR